MDEAGSNNTLGCEAAAALDAAREQAKMYYDLWCQERADAGKIAWALTDEKEKSAALEAERDAQLETNAVISLQFTKLEADNEELRREVERLTTENARFRLEYPKAVDHLDKAAGLMRRFSTLHQNDGGKLAEDNRVFLAEIGKP